MLLECTILFNNTSSKYADQVYVIQELVIVVCKYMSSFVHIDLKKICCIVFSMLYVSSAATRATPVRVLCQYIAFVIIM